MAKPKKKLILRQNCAEQPFRSPLPIFVSRDTPLPAVGPYIKPSPLPRQGRRAGRCLHPSVVLVPVVVVEDAQRLLLARLLEVPAELRPVEPVGFDLAVAAGEVLEGRALEADLGLLQEAVAPAAEVCQLREDEASLPAAGATETPWGAVGRAGRERGERKVKVVKGCPSPKSVSSGIA